MSARKPGSIPAGITPVARRILQQFADAYPMSAHYRGGRALRKAKWHELMPEITRDVDAKQRFLDAVDELVAGGILSVRWRRFREGDEVEALYLQQPDALYRVLGRRSPAEVAAAQRTVLHQATPPPGSLAAAVATHVAALLDAAHPSGFADEAELRDTLRLLSLHPEEAGSLPIRALSVRLFGDSKRIESLLRVADSASLAAAGVRASERLALERSYPEASIALWGKLCLGGGRSWQLRGEILTLPLATVTALEAVEFSGPLTTVENKESFAVFVRSMTGGAAVYTGGHPNRAVQSLIRAAAVACDSARHFGDMDPEGLLIYQEIAAIIPHLRPLLMDPATYDRVAPHGRPLTAKEIAVLDRISRPELEPLVARMRARRIAVEQEVIDLPQ